MKRSAVLAVVLKELRQVRQSRRALVTAVLLPAFFMLYFPLTQGFFFSGRVAASSAVDVDVSPLSQQARPGDGTRRFCGLATPRGANNPLPGITLRFYPQAAQGDVVTGQDGVACGDIPVPSTLGQFPVNAFPVGRSTGQLTGGNLLVTPYPGPAIPRPASPAPPAAAAFLDRFASPGDLFRQVLFPFFLALAALTVPTSFAVQTVLTEREKGTLALLTALPVRVTEILAAKMLAVMAVSVAVVLPLFGLDIALLGVDRLGGPGLVCLDLLLLACSILASGGLTLVMALLIREMRSTNQLIGFLTLPGILGIGGVLFLLPAPWNLAVASALMLAGGALALFAAGTWITFERYLE